MGNPTGIFCDFFKSRIFSQPLTSLFREPDASVRLYGYLLGTCELLEPLVENYKKDEVETIEHWRMEVSVTFFKLKFSKVHYYKFKLFVSGYELVSSWSSRMDSEGNSGTH